MQDVIYVLNGNGHPLMPTKRKRHVQRLLNTGKARIVSKKPFTIQLKYTSTEFTQKIVGGTDPGRTNIGNAVVGAAGEVLYRDHVETRNKEIPGLMDERKAHRQASRRGERQARKRLAKKHGTLSTKIQPEGILIAGCEELTPVKDIRNTEARFSNRVRHGYSDVIPDAAWVTPTVNQLIQTHLNHVDQICRIMPVTDWVFEENKFAFMLMEDGTVRGTDFQNGRMKGYASVEEYVYVLQEGKCACCGKPIYDVHHIIPRHKHGSDGPENRVGLCDDCHHLVHTGELDIDKVGERQKYGALSVLNQAIPFIIEGLIQRFGNEHVTVVTGKDTALRRNILGAPKDHDMDAVVIASYGIEFMPKMDRLPVCWEVKQYRRHDRQIVKSQRERTYYKEEWDPRKEKYIKVPVAKNRKPREEQKSSGYPALSQYAAAGNPVNCLTVKKSLRYYNNVKREWHPGDQFMYQGTIYTVSGQQNNGYYLNAYCCPGVRFSTKNVTRVSYNKGLVYV